MQLSTNFTTIFLAKSPRARGAWVPGCRRRLLLQGWGRARGVRALGSGDVYRLQGWDRSRGAREPGCRLPRRSQLDAHAGYRTVDEQAAKVNYYSLYLPIYPSHNGCRMHLGIVSKRKDRHGQPYRSCRWPLTQIARPHAGRTRAPLRNNQSSRLQVGTWSEHARRGAATKHCGAIRAQH